MLQIKADNIRVLWSNGQFLRLSYLDIDKVKACNGIFTNIS